MDMAARIAQDRRRLAADALAELTRTLCEKGFSARVVQMETRPPFVRASNRKAPQLSENVTCGLGETGELFFFYSWGDPITPVRQIGSAAERVGRILTPRPE